MSTTRNTKGQFARKTAPKKPVKKPTQLDRIERLLKATFDAQMIVAERMNRQQELIRSTHEDIVAQIQRDIEQVRTLAHQTRTNSRANTVILNKILEGVDMLKSGSSFMQEVEQHRAQPEEQGLEDGDYCDASPELLADLWKMGFEKDPGRLRPFVNWHAKRRTMITHDVLTGYEGRPFRQLPPADFLSRACVTAKKLGLVPEEPKAEPWAPKSGERVVVLDGRGVKVKYNPGWVSDLTEMIGRIVEVVPSINPRFVRVKETIMDFAVEWLRPATPEEIAEAERQEKLKKLVRGCRVDTPDGEGIYLGFDGSEDEREHIVSLYTDAPQYASFTYSLDQLTPLT